MNRETPFGKFVPTPKDPTTLVKPPVPPAMIERHEAEKRKQDGQDEAKRVEADGGESGKPSPEAPEERKKKIDAASGRNSVKEALFGFLKKPNDEPENEDGKGKDDKDGDEPPTMTPEQIAKLSAESAAAAVGKVVDRLGEVMKPQKTEAEIASEEAKRKREEEKKDPNWLPEEYRQDADLYDALAKVNPDAYGDIRKRIRKAHESEEAYVAEWERKNPGKEFDGTDEEHSGFYAKNEVTIPEADLKAAREVSVEIRTERVAKETVKKERDSRAAAELAENAKREADQRGGEETLRVLAEANPEYSIVGKSGPEADDVLQKIQKDRVFVEAVNSMAPTIASHFSEVVLIYNGLSKLDVSNPTHATIVKAANEAHRKVAALPPEKREKNGRMFVPAIQYNSMPAQDRAKFWTIGPDEIMAEMRGGFASAIRARMKEIRRFALEVAGLPPEEGDGDPGEKSSTTSSQSTTSSTRTPPVSPGMAHRRDRTVGGGRGDGADLFFRNVKGA